MSFNRDEVCQEIEDSLRNKLNKYSPEPNFKPLHGALLGDQRMRSFELVHSINTTMGSIFERVAARVATNTFDTVVPQYIVNSSLTSSAQSKITEITNGLSQGTIKPNHEKEIEEIRKVCRSGKRTDTKHKRADLYLRGEDCTYLIDVKTAKPNKSGFEKYKHEMLTWSASLLFDQPKINVRTIVGIPYNPYHPRAYNRLNCYQQLDSSQVLVGKDFWSFLGQDDSTFDRVLECFESVGKTMAHEIDRKLLRLGWSIE